MFGVDWPALWFTIRAVRTAVSHFSASDVRRRDNMFAELVLQPLQLFSGDFLSLAVVFFVLAVLAAALGARGVAGISMSIAKWLVVIFVVLAIVSLIL